MTFTNRAAPIAAVIVCAVATSALAAGKPSGLRAIQVECMKQHGAYEDPQTRRLTMHGTLNDMQLRIDAIYACVAQKTGKPAVPFISQTMHAS